MKAWPETTLKKVAKKIDYGYTASATETNTGVKFLRITDIAPRTIDWSAVPYCEISEGDFEKSKLSYGDIVIARTGATVGYAKQIGKNQLRAVFASYLVRVKLKDDVSSKFVGLLVESSNFKNYISTIAGGSAQPNANAKDLSSYPFYLPPKPAQEKIAAILSAYDDLIENNQRRIALLEKMAEEIYREWFVRMRFPGHEQVEKVKGVPEDWQRTKVVALTSYLKRGVAPQYDELAEGVAINQKCIRDGKLDLSFARHQSRDVSPDRQIRFGDVLVNSTGEGTLGRVAQVLFPLANSIVDSHVTIVRPKSGVPIHFFGMTLKAWEVHFCNMGRGATNQTELAPSVIGGVDVIMPSKHLQDAFEAQAEP
ncbi:MAG: restriction endonuclease subunit S, partial [Sulfuriferula sp.]